MRYVSVAVGAMLGANLRFVVGNSVADRWGTDFPYGTFAINVSGAFVIGVFLAFMTDRVGINPLWRLFFATGFWAGTRHSVATRGKRCCSPRVARGYGLPRTCSEATPWVCWVYGLEPA